MSNEKDKSPHITPLAFLEICLVVLFIALKLCGVIDWSWVWVLAPLWIPLAIMAILFMLIGLCKFIVDKKAGE